MELTYQLPRLATMIQSFTVQRISQARMGTHLRLDEFRHNRTVGNAGRDRALLRNADGCPLGTHPKEAQVPVREPVTCWRAVRMLVAKNGRAGCHGQRTAGSQHPAHGLAYAGVCTTRTTRSVSRLGAEACGAWRSYAHLGLNMASLLSRALSARDCRSDERPLPQSRTMSPLCTRTSVGV